MLSCDSARLSDKWAYDPQLGHIVHQDRDLCLTVEKEDLSLQKCQSDENQRWTIEDFKNDKKSS